MRETVTAPIERERFLGGERHRTDRAPLLVLAAVAASLMAYSYLYAMPAGDSWLPQIIRLWVNVPLGIGDDFGVFGLFVLLVLGGYLGGTALASRLAVPPAVPALALLAQLVACFAVMLAGARADGALHVLGLVAATLPVVIFGEAAGLVRRAWLRPWMAGSCGLLCFCLLVMAATRYREFSGQWYPLSALYAGVTVLLVGALRPSSRATSDDRRPGYYHGLDLLRVVASSLVIYTHFINWFAVNRKAWPALSWVEQTVNSTLHLNAHLALAGVMIFFVISGIVVTHVTGRESPGLFAWRRITRVLPLMIAVTSAVWLLIWFGLDVGAAPPSILRVSDLLANLDFSAFFSNRQVFVLAVTWTLLIQLVFYAYVALTMPLLRVRPWLPSIIAWLLSAIFLMLGSGSSIVGLPLPGLREVASVAAYLPVLVIGQLISLTRSRKIHPAVAAAIAAGLFGTVVWADYLGTGAVRVDSAVPRTLALTLALVLLTMSVCNRLTASWVIRSWSARTYAIYLVNSSVIYPVLALLVPRVGPWVACAAALAATALVTEAMYRYVEMPINRLLRGRRR
ncbi:MAG: acyltransferase family protein [Sciscionella sp.]